MGSVGLFRTVLGSLAAGVFWLAVSPEACGAEELDGGAASCCLRSAGCSAVLAMAGQWMQ